MKLFFNGKIESLYHKFYINQILQRNPSCIYNHRVSRLYTTENWFDRSRIKDKTIETIEIYHKAFISKNKIDTLDLINYGYWNKYTVFRQLQGIKNLRVLKFRNSSLEFHRLPYDIKEIFTPIAQKYEIEEMECEGIECEETDIEDLEEEEIYCFILDKYSAYLKKIKIDQFSSLSDTKCMNSMQSLHSLRL